MKYQYQVGEIIAEWRKDKERGYAARIAKKFNIPQGTVHNIIHRHRKRRQEQNRRYREKLLGKNITKTPKRRITMKYLQSQVFFVSARHHT